MHDNTNSKSLGYWLTTGVLAVVLLTAGIMSLMGRPEITEMMEQLGYPLYLAALLGIAKVLGAVAIIAPKLPRLKEWAYAGIVFDLGGALFSHMRMGNFDQTIAPLMLLLLALASWYLRPADRKLANPK